MMTMKNKGFGAIVLMVIVALAFLVVMIIFKKVSPGEKMQNVDETQTTAGLKEQVDSIDLGSTDSEFSEVDKDINSL